MPYSLEIMPDQSPQEQGGTSLPKETSKGLPVIKPGTTTTINEQFSAPGSWGEHLEEVKQRLLRENPHLVEFINSQVSKFPPEMHNPMFEVFVASIAVLEHQAEANKLDSQLEK